jgi:WD40 repeat protein
MRGARARVEESAMAIPTGFDPKQAHVLTQWSVGHPVICCRFDPRGRFVFCGLENAAFQRVSMDDGKKIAFAGGHESWVFSLAVAPGGETTYSGGGDGRVVVWETDAAAPKPIRTIDAHRGWVRVLGVSLDGKLVASGGNDRTVKLWEATTGRLVHELTGHPKHVYSLDFHPDGQSLLTADLAGSIRQWDLATGKAIGSFDAKTLYHLDRSQLVDYGGVRGLAISPDGGSVAGGGLHKASNPLGAVNEPIVVVFDSRTRKLTHTLLADNIKQGVIWGLRYLADGMLVGACGGLAGGFLLFWKPGVEKEFHRLRLPSSARELALHPDGLRLATAHHDGYVRITRLAAGKG